MEASVHAMQKQRKVTSFDLGAVRMGSLTLTPRRFALLVALVPDLYGRIVRSKSSQKNLSGLSFTLSGPEDPRVRDSKMKAVLTQLDKAGLAGQLGPNTPSVASVLEARLLGLPSHLRITLRLDSAPASQTNSVRGLPLPSSAMSQLAVIGSSPSSSVGAKRPSGSKKAESSLAARIAAREAAKASRTSAIREDTLFSALRRQQLATFLLVKFSQKSAHPLNTIVEAAIHTFHNQHSIRYEKTSMASLLNALTSDLPANTLKIIAMSNIRFLRLLSKSKLRAYVLSHKSRK